MILINGLVRRWRSFLFWLVWNVPLGRAAPYVFGLAMGSKPVKKSETEKDTTDG